MSKFLPVWTVIILVAIGAASWGCGGSPEPTPTTVPTRPAPSISAEDFRKTTFALFNELKSMVADGALDPRGSDIGFSPGNPRALRWRKDVEELRDKGGTFLDGLSSEEQCFRLSDAAGDFVCGAELIGFVAIIVGDHWEEYQALAAKFEEAAAEEGQ